MTRAHSFGLVWPYAVAAAVGYLLGSLAVPALAALATGSVNSPLVRVGFALREDPQAAPGAWPALAADVQAVRSSLAAPEREAFDLVVAVRGLDSGGTSDFQRAERVCQTLTWQRCDRATLMLLKEQSRP